MLMNGFAPWIVNNHMTPNCAVRPGRLGFHYIMYSKSADELQLPAQQKQTFSHLHSKYM